MQIGDRIIVKERRGTIRSVFILFLGKHTHIVADFLGILNIIKVNG